MNFFSKAIKVLNLSVTREDILGFSNKDLLLGITGTWLVGIGRYWDDPGAKLLQHFGLGSVIYIFCLSFFIWLIVLPLRVNNWTYKTVLTFVSLTSFPAILYAIPVERFFSIETASTMNIWFLAAVAGWRLIMLFIFLKRYCQLSNWMILTITLLPICLIVNVLSYLNLERAVFLIMGGLREPNANNDAYFVLLVITVLSNLLILPLLVTYIISIINRNKKILPKPLQHQSQHPD